MMQRLAFFSCAVFLFSVSSAFGADIQKESLVGGFWNYKKYYFSFSEDGKLLKQIRLRGKKVISTCKGKYKIKGNTVMMKNCPRLGAKENLEIEPGTLNKASFKAVRVSYNSHAGPDGSRSKPVIFKRVDK